MSAESVQKFKVVERGNGEEGKGHSEESGYVDRLRDVLFGAQMRDYDDRFRRLDERLAGVAGEARADVQKRVETLEKGLRSEIELLTNRLNADRLERRLGIEQLMRKVAETARTFEIKIQNLGEETTREIHGLREQLFEQSNALRTEIKEKHEQMQVDLDRDTEQIRGAITKREALAEMLSEVSLRQRVKDRFLVTAA
jgi:hypothetical protein